MTAGAAERETESKQSVRPVRGLLTILGVVFGLSVVVGNTVGIGILRTPGQVAQLLPNPWLFIAVWFFGAFYALLGANSFSELATMTPESGGYTVLVRRGLGEYAGFVVGWSDWLVTCSALALAVMLIGEYGVALFSANPRSATPIAVALIIGFAGVQWHGTRAGSTTQNATAIAKTLTFALLIAACFALGAGFQNRGPQTSQLSSGFSLFAAVVLAVQAVIFTYDGYYGIIYFSGELRNPGRDIPRVMFGGVFALALIYILVNLAFLYVLTPSRMAGDSLVAATAAREIFGSSGDTVIRTLTILSLLSAANASALMASRVLYRLGSVGYLAVASRVNRGGTPTVGLFLSTVAALTLVLTGTFEAVVAVTVFFFVANYTLAFASLLLLRKTEPSTPRPFRAKGHPWTTWGVLIISVAFLIGTVAADTRNSLYSIILLALSWPIYLVVRPKTPQP